MKKIIIINVVALFTASMAFAVGDKQVTWTDVGKSLYGAKVTVSVTNGKPDAGTSLLGKCSTGVAAGWRTAKGGYAVNTQHQQGTKAFGTSYDSTAMWQTDVTKGTAVDTPAHSDSSAFNGVGSWRTM
jgi:hypothetical protein